MALANPIHNPQMVQPIHPHFISVHSFCMQWFEKNKTSPMTGQALKKKDLIPNHLVKAQIQDYVQTLKKHASKKPPQDLKKKKERRNSSKSDTGDKFSEPRSHRKSKTKVAKKDRDTNLEALMGTVKLEDQDHARRRSMGAILSEQEKQRDAAREQLRQNRSLSGNIGVASPKSISGKRRSKKDSHTDT